MASRGGFVDDSVIERRLRPIYDWLDNGNNKKAMQEADKVLRKQPKLQCAKVLKALALLRLGKNNECLGIIDSVVDVGTSDESTLQALTICYREMHQPEQICSVYETAAKLDPKNEEIISHLFMAHVRVGDYKKQQRTAMQLYKLKPKNPYYFWAVMSILMQYQVSTDSVARTVFLDLAERMVARFISENKIDSEAEIMTYLYILETQEKYTEALAVLNGPLASKIIQQPQNFIPMKKATYHSKLQQYDASSIIYMNLIRHEPDNWQHYVNLTETVLRMHEEPIAMLVDQADPLLEASKFLKEIKINGLQTIRTARSPTLGLLQFALKLQERKMQEKIQDLCGDVEEQLIEYVKHYSDKMCCYGDIVIFIPLIPVESRPVILQKIKSFIQFDENGRPTDINNIYRHQFYFQLMKSFGLQEAYSVSDHVALADELVNFYNNTTHLWTDMAPTDIRPNDTYLILAAHSYFEALRQIVENKDSKGLIGYTPSEFMIKLCCLLEHGIELSKANFQMKLLLIKAYNMMGATEVSFIVYEKLDLKLIQMDTLGHLLSLQSLDTGRHNIADVIFSTTLKFFMANNKDTSEPLILSYKVGSLVKIPEFVEFRNRLNNSLQFDTVIIEQMLLETTTKIKISSDLHELMQELEIESTKDKADWGSLRDNRDLNVFNSWEPKHRKMNSELRTETFKSEVLMLKLRRLILKFIAAGYQLRKNQTSSTTIKSMTNGDSNGTCDNDALNDLHTQLHNETTNCDKYAKLQPLKLPLQGPDNSRIFVYSKGGYFYRFLDHADLLHFIHNCIEGHNSFEDWTEDRMQKISENIDCFILSHFSHLENFQLAASMTFPSANNVPLTHLWHFVQTIGFIVVLLECCNSLLTPIRKKTRKKKTNVSVPEIVIDFNTYVEQLGEKLQKFESALSDKVTSSIEVMKTNQKLEYRDLRLNIPIEELQVKPSKLCQSIEDSFYQSLNAMLILLQGKIKFLASLKV